MKFKMVIAFLPEERLDEVLDAARRAGATGSTVITRPEERGWNQSAGFWGWRLPRTGTLCSGWSRKVSHQD